MTAPQRRPRPYPIVRRVYAVHVDYRRAPTERPRGVSNLRTDQQPWWAREISRLRATFLAYVSRRASFDPGSAPEYVDRSIAELTERLTTQPEAFPPSWFELLPPPEEEAARFRGLAWQVCRRRLFDGLRHHYARRLWQSGTAAETVLRTAPDPHLDPEASASSRELLVALAQRIDALDVADRELLARATLDDDDFAPLTAAERMKLMRLRRRLADEVKVDLGR